MPKTRHKIAREVDEILSTPTLASIPLTIWSNGRLIKNPIWIHTFGPKGNRGQQTERQKANFARVQEFNRKWIGVGPTWNS